ncbi:hypothetical protein EJ03DRAFT_390581 [Teratosphaeria nubilosa]|uniref:Calcium permease family membrane transporter n=1 Tax=Teratosphaeria nubilosa TaxID=161662 RepID=A0A6G1L3J2_9PEZI|nr:hypothetical protein EJ03DRAFT_390581 [Teratosphaeria nubilosa]
MADNDSRGREPATNHSATHTRSTTATAADHASTASDARMPDTRRTSSTSSTGLSNAGAREAARDTTQPSQTSQTSVASADDGSATRQRPRPLDYGTIQSAASVRTLSQNTPSRASRPSAIRTPSAAAPHRGQQFSVDDDVDEVNNDIEADRQRSKHERERIRDQARDRALKRRESKGTLRRRATALPPTLQTVDSEEREEEEQTGAHVSGNDAHPPQRSDSNGEPSSEETLQGDEEEDDVGDVDVTNDDVDLSDAESFTLKDRQEAINETHPFGIRIWKPALYKKNRSVQKNAEGDIHSAPGGNVSHWLFIFNVLWTLIFGWWLSLLAGLGGVVNLILYYLTGLQSCYDYGRVLINLSHYLLYPFGKYLKLEHDEAYAHEDEGEGRDISEYERWQAGDLEEGRLFFGPTDINRSLIGRRRDEVEDLDPQETDGLLGRPGRQSSIAERARNKTKKRLFGRGKWNLGRVVFFVSFYFLITPFLFLVSGVCWFLVFTIPMGKVTLLLFYHLRRHPLALSFHTDSHYGRVPSIARGDRGPSILLCTYRAVGLKYWKYTIDGTNIFLINLLGLVVFVIFDYFVLFEALGVRTWLTSNGLIFVLALASIIPLAYFIGQAVASISAQSSMGVGATINAFFSTVVEVFLYCVALQQGKSQLVEGSIIGSIFAGILFLPGLSMCFGAIRRKTQRFNVKSAGVTSTMLLFAVIGAFGPTLFYQIYGSHELNCHQCVDLGGSQNQQRDCRRCYFAQAPAIQDRFFIEAVQPYTWFACICLFLSYLVGLLFTLRTHAAVIWNNEPDEKKDAKMEEGAKKYEDRHASIVPGGSSLAVSDGLTPTTPSRPGAARGETTSTIGSLARENIKDSQMYKRILHQSLKQAGSSPSAVVKKDEHSELSSSAKTEPPFVVPPKDAEGSKSVRIAGLSAEDNRMLVQQVAEMAATAAAVAARDATKAPLKSRAMLTTSASSTKVHSSRDTSKDTGRQGSVTEGSGVPAVAEGEKQEEHASGGHDAPNWSRTKSAVILLTATLAYAIIAEILVDTVDAVLAGSDIDEKFLGITLFALVPNTTEFLNAISFAMNGNVALSMEIGSSYALQVMLLQIPCLVLFTAFYTSGSSSSAGEMLQHGFHLIFPQWDMVTVILAVFLMGWVVGEGKSNYFKGSTLIFTYAVVVVGFWFGGFGDVQTNRFDTLALGGSPQFEEVFRTVGRGRSGRAW